MTNGRVTAALVLIWSLGFIFAAFNFAIVTPAPVIKGQAFLSETPLMPVIAFVVEIPTCLTLIVISLMGLVKEECLGDGGGVGGDSISIHTLFAVCSCNENVFLQK